MEDELRLYEMLLIIDPTIDESGAKEVVEKVETLIKDGNGEILFSAPWGKKKLAYEIKKFKRAQYAILQFKLTSEPLTEIERRIKLDERILRHLTIIIKPNMLITDSIIAPSADDGRGSSYGRQNRGRDEATA